MATLLTLAGGVLVALAVVGVVIIALLLLRAGGPAAFLEKHLFPDANQINLQGGATKNLATGNVYRILAFGDSLTEGFTDGGQAFHPYAKKVGDLIYPEMPQGWHLEIEEQGESGERVLIGMNHRLQRTLDEHTTAQRPYDWVLLLGGINDIAGDDCVAEEVMAGLDVLVQKCLAHGAHVMLMTLLEVAMPVERVEQQRLKLNQLIKDYVMQRTWDKQAAAGSSGAEDAQQAAAGIDKGISGNSSSSRRGGTPRVVLFDLSAALPYEKMGEQQRWEVWHDGVHLTMVGYDYMGGLITQALLPLVKQELGVLAAEAGNTAAGAAVATAVANGQLQGKKVV